MSMSTTPTTMQSHADNYLNERRQLGFGLRSIDYAIKSFARYVDDLGNHESLTVEVMADWARRDKGNSNKPATWARRLIKIRMFARYLQQFEPNTEVPDDTIFGRIGQRLAPHIYSDQEIVDPGSSAMPRVRCHRRGKQNPPASVAQTETPRNSSRLENSPGIRSEIVPLPLGAPSRPPQVAGRDATIHHMGLPGTTG